MSKISSTKYIPNSAKLKGATATRGRVRMTGLNAFFSSARSIGEAQQTLQTGFLCSARWLAAADEGRLEGRRGCDADAAQCSLLPAGSTGRCDE